jgi:Undecaprenyl-phosphate glucose phosphotransferase
LVKQQHQLFVTLLALVDAVVVCAACVAAWGLRLRVVEGWAPKHWEDWVKGPLFIFAVPIVLVTMWMLGLYRPRRDRSLLAEQGEILRVTIAAMAALIVALWAVGDSTVMAERVPTVRLFGHLVDGGRVQLALLAGILPVFLGIHRAMFRKVLREIRRRGFNLRHVAIIGVGRLGQITARTLARNSWTGISTAYFISHHPQTKRTECLGKPVNGGLDSLVDTLSEHRVDAVYLALPNAQAAALPAILQKLQRFAVDVRIVPDVHPRFVPQSMVISELDGMPILSYRECPSAGVGGFSKRVLDIAGSALGMVLFSPLFLLIAIAVRMSSPGRVIFKQRRVSLGGKTFKIYKFRTMYQVSDERRELVDPLDGWTRRGDPRITPVGMWLRRTSLDELPQLLNVLKGQMSLVGPRPERPELIQKFREDWRGYMLRQHVKAGMTGWAQVNGLRGHTSIKKRLQYDLFYVRHWSLSFDLRILWLTVFRGFVHRNAH